MDKSSMKWWMFPRSSKEYSKGVDEYIEKAFANEARGDEIRCPCKVCYRRNWLQRQTVKDHMIVKGFHRLPEEVEQQQPTDGNEVDDGANKFEDNMDDLLHDTFSNGPNEEATSFYKLVEEAQEELYPGCKSFSKLSFLIRLFVHKRDHKLSNGAFTDLLRILKAMQPDAKLPSSYNEAKKVLKILGLEYTKIDACINDCILYWEENAEGASCPICKTSRWKSDEKDDKTSKASQIPAKVLRYFPVKKRLQRLFMCREIAQNMTWHADGRPKDGRLRHLADGESWKNFELMYPSFATDSRNVRLGLASDGFSPFNSMSIVHSTWPVILTTYNLPPWMSMKSEFLMLALIIPGPSSPGNDIDVYLQPLIKDLKELFMAGIETYDASRNEMFNMRAALMTTISDFPGFAMLSGWSTKGKLACPSCHYETRSHYLTYSKKMCYIGHRRFLRSDHPYRRDNRHFNKKIDVETAPVRLSGSETLELMAGFKNEFGKNKPKEVKRNKKSTKKKKCVCHWKKKSIFFDLPYWKHIEIRHCLDVMHIEKNICDNIIGTLLDISGKTKDHVKARMDLVELDMMEELQPKVVGDGDKLEIAKSRFWMTGEEKRRFCTVIKTAKLAKVCDSNIGRCVQVQQRRIVGYKSHDAHFFMHYLLPIVVKTCLPEDVARPFIRLSAFFKAICKKVIDPEDLDYLQSEISEILCQFEMIFPGAFFDIMVHLPIHLVEEIRLGGPVCQRWMYPIERDLRKLKSYVRNKSRPEGSMAESYLVDECTAFCARYLHRGSTIIDEQIGKSCFPKMGHPILGKGRRRKATNHERSRIDDIKWAPELMFPKDKKFIVPNEGKPWVLGSVGSKWRAYKGKVKEKHYSPYTTMAEMLASRPNAIPKEEFIELMQYFASNKAKEISKKNKENRAKQVDMHTLGTVSYAVKRHLMQQNDPHKQCPSEVNVYTESRKRVARRTYVTQNEETLSNIEKMKSVTSVGEGSSKTDPYFDVITKKEHNGRLRMHGLGVTKSSFKCKDVKTPFVLPEVFLEGIAEHFNKKMEDTLISVFSKLRDANPGVDIVIPNFSTNHEDGSTSHESSENEEGGSTSHGDEVMSDQGVED